MPEPRSRKRKSDIAEQRNELELNWGCIKSVDMYLESYGYFHNKKLFLIQEDGIYFPIL